MTWLLDTDQEMTAAVARLEKRPVEMGTPIEALSWSEYHHCYRRQLSFPIFHQCSQM